MPNLFLDYLMVHTTSLLSMPFFVYSFKLSKIKINIPEKTKIFFDKGIANSKILSKMDEVENKNDSDWTHITLSSAFYNLLIKAALDSKKNRKSMQYQDALVLLFARGIENYYGWDDFITSDKSLVQRVGERSYSNVGVCKISDYLKEIWRMKAKEDNLDIHTYYSNHEPLINKKI